MNMSNNQFGLIVAYLLPGFIGLAGIAPFVPLVAAWLKPGSYAEASLGPPIYAVLAAATIGMIVSCFRWLVIDQIHHWTGVKAPVWDDSRLEDRLSAFSYLVENHYRYYQFLANTLVAVLFAYSIDRWITNSSALGAGTDLGVFILCVVLFAGSRDSLAKYYERTTRLIGRVAEKGSEAMTNGNHHEGGAKPSPKLPDEAKPNGKSPSPPKPEQNKMNGAQSPK